MIGPQAFKESSINKYNPISPNEVESGPTKTIQQAHMTTQHLTASSTTRPSQIHSTAQLSSLLSLSLSSLRTTMQTLLLPSTAVAAGPSFSTSHFPRRPIPARQLSNFTVSLPNTNNSLSSSKTFQSLCFSSPSYVASTHRGPKLSFTVRASQFSSPNDETEQAKLSQVLFLIFLFSFNFKCACLVAQKMLV